MADLTIRVGGEGGEGIISTGDFIAAIAAKAGNNILTFKTFPAEIKGGYAMYQTRISDEKVLCEGDGFDIMVAFNGEAHEMNKKFLTPRLSHCFTNDSVPVTLVLKYSSDFALPVAAAR